MSEGPSETPEAQVHPASLRGVCPVKPEYLRPAPVRVALDAEGRTRGMNKGAERLRSSTVEGTARPTLEGESNFFHGETLRRIKAAVRGANQASKRTRCGDKIEGGMGESCTDNPSADTVSTAPMANIDKEKDEGPCLATKNGDVPQVIVNGTEEAKRENKARRSALLSNKLVLAPLTTVGNLPFRRICKGYGADVTLSEMAIVHNLNRLQKNEWSLLRRHESEDIFGLQIAVSRPQDAATFAQAINASGYSYDFIDINCGCPVDRIVQSGCGCGLWERKGRMRDVVYSLVQHQPKPVTVKCRIGPDEEAPSLHKQIAEYEDWGVSGVTIHGRSRKQRYTKLANWKYVDECATLTNIPVIGNGDILSYDEIAEHRVQNPHINSYMIGRGALIKPWIFDEIKTGQTHDISSHERFEMLRNFCNYGLSHWGSDERGVLTTRRYLCEWLSFLCRYIPVGLLERPPQRINERPPFYEGRDELETLMVSDSVVDWIHISELLLGPSGDKFKFTPKHKSNSYATVTGDTATPKPPLQWNPPLDEKHQRPANSQDRLVPFLFPETEKDRDGVQCRSGVHLEWTTRVGSSVFATPRIVDLSHDGNKEILIPTYTQYFEALDGANGDDVAGFPFVHPNFKSYASPLPVDMDGDGKTEWLVAMYTGELMIFGDDGKARGAVKIPPLPIKKNWVKKNITKEGAVNVHFKKMKRSEEWMQELLRVRRIQDLRTDGRRIVLKSTNEPQNMARHGRRISQIGEVHEGDKEDAHDDDKNVRDVRRFGDMDDKEDDDDDDDDRGVRDVRRFRDMDDVKDMFEEIDTPADNPLGSDRGIGTNGWMSKEARSSMDLLFSPELFKSSVNYEEEKDPFHFLNIRSPETVIIGADEIAVDPHIMSTPVLVNIDGDSDLDIVVHVSYFFDTKDYEGEKSELLPSDIDPGEYVADAVVALNLVTGEIKWLNLLHLTTIHEAHPAYALSSPAVANTNADSLMEIFVTTTAGAIFGFSGTGKPLKGWPVWMESITASPSLEDVNGDGVLDICAGDADGNVGCFTPEGKELWKKHVPGGITDHITFGDVDGDGAMDLSFGTSMGFLYVLRGRDGSLLPHFPVATEGPILAPPLLVNLNATPNSHEHPEEGLHVVVPSHDGVLYIVSGTTGCMDSIDVDEKSSSMVLVDDMTGNGKLDLVLTTLSGSVMVFETAAPFHPLKSWVSRVKGINGVTASEGNVGVFIHPSSREARDVRGDTFTLLVGIYDKRKGAGVKRRYDIIIVIGQRVLVHRKIYTEPGIYTIKMHAPLERMYASVTVGMMLPNGQTFEDSVALSFNMHFLESIKLTFVLPFLVACLALSFVNRRHEVEPPPFDSTYYF